MALSAPLSATGPAVGPGGVVRTVARAVHRSGRPRPLGRRATGPVAGWSRAVPPDPVAPPRRGGDGRPRRGRRAGARSVSVAPEGGAPTVASGREPGAGRRAAAAGALGAVVAGAVGLGLGLAGRGPDAVPAPGAGDRSGAAAGRCAADGHRDTRATGLTPERIPTLPADYSFFDVASDGCSPVRWNPCEPVHYVINPTDAPPTGVADVKEAFARLAEATGMTFVDDGVTDEGPPRGADRAYQPARYPGRWAPILVHWETGERTRGDVQIAGAGLPTRVGDVYVSASLSLDPDVVTDLATRTTVAGGFGSGSGSGPIGAQGVSWGRVILHELAHITGLGHSRSPSNLMYPETSEQTGAAVFSQDDRAGLELLGLDAGCLETPAPAPVSDRGHRSGTRRP